MASTGHGCRPSTCVWLPSTFLEPGVIAAEGHPYPGMLHVGRFRAGADDC
jgi:2-dehydropantoate 2-reductase